MFVKKKRNPGGVVSKPAAPPYLLLLRFPSFHTNPPDFQYRFGRLGVPGPETLLEVLPDGVPGFRISFPAQTDLQQVTNILLSEHQEGVGQVQTDDLVVAAQKKGGEIGLSPRKLNTEVLI